MPITRLDKYMPLKMKNVTHYPKFATKLQLFFDICKIQTKNIFNSKDYLLHFLIIIPNSWDFRRNTCICIQNILPLHLICVYHLPYYLCYPKSG